MKLTWRMWLLIICMILALIAIVNVKSFYGGIEIKSVVPNSTAMNQGLTAGEIIKQLNGQKIEDVEDYSSIVSAINVSPVQFSIITDKGNFDYESKTLDFEINENLSIIKVIGNAEKEGIYDGIKLMKINNDIINDAEDFEKAKENIVGRP